MVQNIIVGLIVGAAVLFVLRRWLPAALRDPLLARIAGIAREAKLPALAQRLDPRSAHHRRLQLRLRELRQLRHVKFNGVGVD